MNAKDLLTTLTMAASAGFAGPACLTAPELPSPESVFATVVLRFES